MDADKLLFIKDQFISLTKTLNSNSKAKWGKMNAQQMIEHVTDFFKVSTGKLHFDLVTPKEHLPKYLEFLLSDKEFRENTKAPILPDEPFPIRNESFEIALENLNKEIQYFVSFYSNNQDKTNMHPVFGNLNYEQWILLHYKHVLHHAKQFNLI